MILKHHIKSGYIIIIPLVAAISIYFWGFRSYQGAGRTKWEAPATTASLVNPQKNNPGAIEAGKQTYTTYCVACHGSKGKGDGAAAIGLNVKPADHTSANVQKQPDGALFWKISEGRSPMPTYKTLLTETQRWQLVEYIRTFNKASRI
jgi:mono/diheme cytochrome c family protein